MPTLQNPFTSPYIPLASTNADPRFPVSQPASATASPFVPTTLTFSLASTDISNVVTALTTIQTWYTNTAGGVNAFGITTLQELAVQSTLALFSGLAAGSVTFTVAQLQNIVTVSQMVRSWSGVNVNLMTQAQLVIAMGRILTVSITTPGSNYVTGTYSDITFTGGSGSFATATITVGNLPTLSSLTIVNAGSGYTAGSYSNVALTHSSTVGPIATLGSITPGTLYTTGTYAGVPLTGGTGTGAQATIVVAGGGVTSVTITTAGSGYTVTDVLSASAGNIGNTGSGFSVPVATTSASSGSGATANVTVGGTGAIATVSVSNPGSGYITGTYTNVPLNDNYSANTGALGTVVVGIGGTVSSVTVTNGGSGYGPTNNVEIPSGQLGNTTGSGFVGTVTIIQGITHITVVSAGTGYLSTDTLTISNTLIGGSGSGLLLQAVPTSGVTSIGFLGGGFNYVIGDVLSVVNTDLDSPNGSGFTATVTGINTTVFKEPISNQPEEAFPNGCTTITVNDGYGLVEQPNSGNFWTSDVQNFINWNALAEATIESRSDQLVAVDQIGGGNVVLFGTRSLEYWFDNGTFPLAFARATGQQQDWGLAAKWSRANVQGSLMFLGQNFQGNPEVVWLNGYSPEPVSTSDLESIINTFEVIDDAIGFSYNMNGHTFYQITFPSANRSFLYDMDTDIWSEVQSGTAEYNRHLASLGISYNTGTYVSDASNGNLYYLDQNNYTDNGSLIMREVTSQHIFDQGNQVSIAQVYLDMQTGVGTNAAQNIGDSANPQITMEVSKDYGNTFGQPRPTSMGLIGQYRGPRVVWRRIGSARDLVFRFKTTSPVPFLINFGSATFQDTIKD